MNQKAEFLKYYNATGSTALLLVLGTIFLGFGIFACIIAPSPLIILFFMGMGIFMIGTAISISRKSKAYIRGIEQSGEMNIIVADFAQAAPQFSGNMKLGSRYVFCKNSRPVRYQQIHKAYQQVNKSNGMETNRFLILEDAGGRVLGSVALRLKGRSDDNLAYVMSYLKSNNPFLQLGYHPGR